VRVRFTPEARLAVREKRAWWEQHRDKAPGLFVQELGAIVGKLRGGADEQRQNYAARGGRIIWRILIESATRRSSSFRCAGVSSGVLQRWGALPRIPGRCHRK